MCTTAVVECTSILSDLPMSDLPCFYVFSTPIDDMQVQSSISPVSGDDRDRESGEWDVRPVENLVPNYAHRYPFPELCAWLGVVSLSSFALGLTSQMAVILRGNYLGILSNGSGSIILWWTFGLLFANNFFGLLLSLRGLVTMNIYDIYGFCITTGVRLVHSCMYVAIPMEVCYQDKTHIYPVCIVDFTLGAILDLTSLCLVVWTHPHISWLFYKRVGADPSRRKLAMAYLWNTSSTLVDILLSFSALSSLFVVEIGIQQTSLADSRGVILVVAVFVAVCEVISFFANRMALNSGNRKLLTSAIVSGIPLLLFVPPVVIYFFVEYGSALKPIADGRSSTNTSVPNSDDANVAVEKSHDLLVNILHALLAVATSIVLGIFCRVSTLFYRARILAKFQDVGLQRLLQHRFRYSLSKIFPQKCPNFCCSSRKRSRSIRTLSGTMLVGRGDQISTDYSIYR